MPTNEEKEQIFEVIAAGKDPRIIAVPESWTVRYIADIQQWYDQMQERRKLPPVLFIPHGCVDVTDLESRVVTLEETVRKLKGY